MKLPINTIVVLIVLLVVLLIMLVLITRSGTDLVDIGGVKIEGAGGASECQLNCWKCCKNYETPEQCGTILDDTYKTQNCNCVC